MSSVCWFIYCFVAGCIFHIDLDAFLVSLEQALNPKLKGRPVTVGEDPRTGELALMQEK